MQDGLTYDFNLAGSAVARVDAQAVVVVGQQWTGVVRVPGPVRAGGRAVGADVRLDQAEQGRGSHRPMNWPINWPVNWPINWPMDWPVGATGYSVRGEDELHFPGIPSPRAQQGVFRQPHSRVVSSQQTDRRARLGGRHLLP